MAAYLITYDLNRPGQNYEGLFESIKALGAWWHYLDSTWLVKTSHSADQISERLLSKLDDSDYLLVIRVCGEHQGWLKQEAWDWIRENVPRC